MSTTMLDGALDRLLVLAAEHTGFRRDAVSRDRLRRLIADEGARGRGLAELLARAEEGDPQVVSALQDAASVGETYFFRHPEHFELVAHRVVPAWLARRPARPFRAWSAGCATGEEAYSLAATLLATLGAGDSPGAGRELVEVLGTDVSERAIAAARQAKRSAWSLRASGPMLHPLLEETPEPTVAAIVREVTELAVDNLLAPDGPTGFDLVFCRNVLVYFEPEAARRALARLSAALAPGGTLVLGPIDHDGPVPGLVAIPGPVQAFVRPLDGARAEAPSPPFAEPARLAPEQPASPRRAVLLHVEALELIERGDRAAAAVRLGELGELFPEYLPGLLERALFLLRGGAHGAGVALLRDLVRRAEAISPDALLEGPEPLPAEFYLASARQALGARGARP